MASGANLTKRTVLRPDPGFFFWFLQLGIAITDDTVRKHLKKAAATVLPAKPRHNRSKPNSVMAKPNSITNYCQFAKVGFLLQGIPICHPPSPG